MCYKRCMDFVVTLHLIDTQSLLKPFTRVSYRSSKRQPEEPVLASPDLMLPSSRQIPFQRLYSDVLWMLSLACFTSSCFCRIFSQFRTRNTWCFNTKFLQKLGKQSRITFLTVKLSPYCGEKDKLNSEARPAVSEEEFHPSSWKAS